MPDICKHLEFKSEVNVYDLGDGIYKVDLQVACADCFKPLMFVGMPAGVGYEKPTTSLDGTEARLSAKLIS